MITFKRTSTGWKPEYSIEAVAALADLDKINLEVALRDLADEVHEIVDVQSAEGQLRREIARRMNNLASKAQASGMLSAMWSDQNNRFYKQRLAIQSGSY